MKRDFYIVWGVTLLAAIVSSLVIAISIQWCLVRRANEAGFYWLVRWPVGWVVVFFTGQLTAEHVMRWANGALTRHREKSSPGSKGSERDDEAP